MIPGTKSETKSSWSDYFGDKNKVDKTSNIGAFSASTGSDNYYFFNCLFESCIENGAINIMRYNEICTLIEDSVFRKCSSTTYAGSVSYSCSTAGQFVQQRTCYYKSKASSYAAFLQWINPYKKNYAFFVSVSNCGESENRGSSTFYLAWGDICISNINTTNNKCFQCSSILSIAQGNPTKYNFSIFRENSQSSTQSFLFNSNDAALTQKISYCNVIKNNCGKEINQVLFSCSYLTNVDHCIFLNNSAKYMFQQNKEGSNLVIFDSYVELNSATLGTVLITHLNENSDFNTFSHFYTKNCFIDPKDKISSELYSIFNLFPNRRR